MAKRQYDHAELLRMCGELGQRETSRRMGVSRARLYDICKAAEKTMPKRASQKPIKVKPPRSGVRTFIFSSAQDGTNIHEQFLTNLEAYARELDAEIHIAGYTYNKSLYEDHRREVAVFHDRVATYISNRRIDLMGKVVWCGEMNTLPTAVDPLSGFETYTRSKWGIFPHPRVSLKSIATPFKSDPKIIMTTGSVTMPNYIQKKVGIKAEFHHVIGAVLVEIDKDGDFFCRHLIAENDGSFQDLTNYVSDGKVLTDRRVEAITWGDIHSETLDEAVALGSWGLDAKKMITVDHFNMLDYLEPKYQFFHDTLDFRRRNHHNIGDPHFRFKMTVKGTDSVEQEIERAAEFLWCTQRDTAVSVVVDSNHDRALTKWLKHGDYKNDPVNAVFFLKAQTAVYSAIQAGDDNFLPFEWAARQSKWDTSNVIFLRETESFMICGNIECAIHGDKGANGAKGDVRSFSRMGPKANTADKHAAAILEGIYQAGHSCKSDQVYNRGGLSSWNHSHIVTYPNGKRTIITMRRDKFCA